ncbi:conserved hypothetical protein [Culex quinquefasciatus]|uniref:Uncharacterized protein n=1 Tax=Culex quinquefasciatus TaxID=7176 RepID=B0X6E3_CULQU|nr:conserved hypothetical protein [Culex quinquefasciatus]|eukprot:XP_001865215.1 conserved hypothetical protein [Culex quinquefasciatus]
MHRAVPSKSPVRISTEVPRFEQWWRCRQCRLTSHKNSVGTRLLLVPLQTTRSFPFAGCERSPSSNTVSSDSSRTSSCSLWKVVCFCFFVTSMICSAGKKPKLEASSTEEPAAGTDSIPGGGEKCIESPDPDRVHASFKSAEKKTFTVVKKEQPEVKREPSESPKRREGGCGDSGRLQELRDGVQYGRKFWRKGETVTCLARTLQIIERLRMIEILANYFCSVVLILSPDDLLATCAMTPPNHDGFNEPVANALSKCEKVFEGEGGGHCVGAEDGVRQPDCTVAAGGRGGSPGGQLFDDARNTLELGEQHDAPGRDFPVGPHSEGFAKEYIPGLRNIVGVEQISCLEKAIICNTSAKLGISGLSF